MAPSSSYDWQIVKYDVKHSLTRTPISSKIAEDTHAPEQILQTDLQNRVRLTAVPDSESGYILWLILC